MRSRTCLLEAAQDAIAESRKLKSKLPSVGSSVAQSCRTVMPSTLGLARTEARGCFPEFAMEKTPRGTCPKERLGTARIAPHRANFKILGLQRERDVTPRHAVIISIIIVTAIIIPNRSPGGFPTKRLGIARMRARRPRENRPGGPFLGSLNSDKGPAGEKRDPYPLLTDKFALQIAYKLPESSNH